MDHGNLSRLEDGIGDSAKSCSHINRQNQRAGCARVRFSRVCRRLHGDMQVNEIEVGQIEIVRKSCGVLRSWNKIESSFQHAARKRLKTRSCLEVIQGNAELMEFPGTSFRNVPEKNACAMRLSRGGRIVQMFEKCQFSGGGNQANLVFSRESCRITKSLIIASHRCLALSFSQSCCPLLTCISEGCTIQQSSFLHSVVPPSPHALCPHHPLTLTVTLTPGP